MISVVGLVLEEAERMLGEAGFTVRRKQTRSRKGVDGNEARVVRERFLPGGEVELVYAVFKTDHAHGT